MVNAVNEKKETEAYLRGLMTPLLDELGMELVALQCVHVQNGNVVRLYIDKPDGVSLKDCENAHREIHPVFETDPALRAGQFELEVSSPGLNRIIQKADDFERFSGKKVQIQLYKPVEGSKQKNYTGILKGYNDGSVLLEVDEALIKIPMDRIKTARILYAFDSRRQ